MLYTLMNKTTPILTCEIDTVSSGIIKIQEVQNAEYLPVGLSYNSQQFRKELNNWWHGRSIPASRQGLSSALDNMGIGNKDILLTKSFGLSLSDQYWINPGSELNWHDVNFFENEFSEDVGNILFGLESGADKEQLNLSSPDNTSDGWLKKRWKIIDGERCLIKGGSGESLQEPINEAIASIIHSKLNSYPYVEYTLLIDGEEKPYSVCKNFITPDTELVTAWRIMQTEKKSNNTSYYHHLLNCCEQLGIAGMQEYLNYLLTFDYLIANTDRHFNNFGVIRDVNTLKFIGIASTYDSGTSLWHDTASHMIRPERDYDSKPFHANPAKQMKLVTSFDNFAVLKLQGIEQDFNELLNRSPYIDERRREKLCSGLEQRVEHLKQRYIKPNFNEPLSFEEEARDMRDASRELDGGAVDAGRGGDAR